MSIIFESAIRRVAVLGAVPRAVTASAPRAAFSSSVILHKSITQSTKETVTNAAQKVNHAVGDAAVGAIDLGTAAVNKTKDVMPDKGKAADQLQGKASEMQGKASELGGEAKGKASQVAGEAKGKTHEMAGKAKGAAENTK